MTKTKKVYITRNALFKNIPMILCNNITEADQGFIENNWNLFSTPCDTCEGVGEKEGEKCEDCYGEGSHDCEVYQYFIVSVNDWDIERLKSYGVELGYSELLDLHIMPIYDYGTGWSMFSYSKEVAEDYQLSHDETLTRSTPY